MINFNPMNIVQSIMSSKNPSNFMLDMMMKNAPKTPMTDNAMNIIRSGDEKSAEQMVRNLCQSKGLDANKVMAQAKKMFGAN